MTVLLTERTGEYCTGAVMDSEGYRRTLTKQVAIPLKGSLDEQVRTVIAASTAGMCRTVMESVEVTVEGGTARIPPISAWAGASIVMCSCRPEVEVNLLRLPGITRVVWE